jgi:hypothetical protein
MCEMSGYINADSHTAPLGMQCGTRVEVIRYRITYVSRPSENR